MKPKLRTWLVSLYPVSWREHYGEEFSDLLEQCSNSPFDVLDVMLGALDAHLNLSANNGMNWRKLDMINKLRTSILVVFCAFIGFLVAGLTFNGNIDDSPLIPLMRQNIPFHLAYLTIQIGAVIALLAIMIGGLPIALTVIQRAFTSQRKDLRLLLVPVAAFLALAAYAGIILAVGKGLIHLPGVVSSVSPGQPFPAGNRNLFLGLMAVFILGAAASCLAVWRIVSHVDQPENSFKLMGRKTNVKLYHFAFIPAFIASAAMVLMLAASLAWSVIALTALPQAFSGNNGLWGLSTALPLTLSLVLMLLMSILSINAVLRALPAYRQSI
jgi:hypothetical protein